MKKAQHEYVLCSEELMLTGSHQTWIKERLIETATIICVIARKKYGWDYSGKIPKDLTWALRTYGVESIRLISLDSESITFLVLPLPKKDGEVHGHIYTVDREWIHSSNWAIGKRTRVRIAEFKKNELEQKIHKIEAQAARKYAEVLQLEKKTQAASRELSDEKRAYRRLKKSLEELRALK